MICRSFIRVRQLLAVQITFSLIVLATTLAHAQDPAPASDAPKAASPAAATAAKKKAPPAPARGKFSAAAGAAGSDATSATSSAPVEGSASKPAVGVASGTSPTSSAALVAPTCSQDQIDTVVNGLRTWERSFVENEKSAYAQRQCQRADVFCLNRFGQATNDKAPDKVVAGRGFTVYAIVPSFDTAKLVVSSSVSTAFGETAYNSEVPSHAAAAGPATTCELSKLQKEALHEAALPVAKLTSKPGMDLLPIPEGAASDEYWESTPDSQILKDWTIFVASQGKEAPGFVGIGGHVDVQNGEVLSVDVSRTEKGAQFPCAENHYEIFIDQGKYYLEVAMLAPFVYRGDRTIAAHPALSTQDLRLAVEQDWHVTAALALDYFPAGRQRGQLSSFRNCRTRSCVENWLGVQAGLGLSSPFKEWYLGVVFEPVSGFALGLGAAFLQGQFLKPGRAEGMVVPASDVSSEPKFMFRPYIGLSITQDIFNSLERASSAARQLF